MTLESILRTSTPSVERWSVFYDSYLLKFTLSSDPKPLRHLDGTAGLGGEGSDEYTLFI